MRLLGSLVVTTCEVDAAVSLLYYWGSIVEIKLIAAQFLDFYSSRIGRILDINDIQVFSAMNIVAQYFAWRLQVEEVSDIELELGVFLRLAYLLLPLALS